MTIQGHKTGQKVIGTDKKSSLGGDVIEESGGEANENDSGYDSDGNSSEVVKSQHPIGPEQDDSVDAKEGNVFKKNL